MKILAALAVLLLMGACKGEPEYSVIGMQGAMKAVSVPAESAANIGYYREVIEAECPRSRICIMSFFVGPSSVSWPLTDSMVEAQTAQYNRNPNSGMDRLLLACRLVDGGASECF